MFDLTSTATLESVPNWFEEASRACSGVSSGDVPCFLAGNKADLPDKTVTDAAIQVRVINTAPLHILSSHLLCRKWRLRRICRMLKSVWRTTATSINSWKPFLLRCSKVRKITDSFFHLIVISHLIPTRVDVKLPDPAAPANENVNRGKATKIEEKKSGCCVTMWSLINFSRRRITFFSGTEFWKLYSNNSLTFNLSINPLT